MNEPIGALCNFKVLPEDDKFNAKVKTGYLLGMHPNSKAYRVWDPLSCKIVVSGHVTFPRHSAALSYHKASQGRTDLHSSSSLTPTSIFPQPVVTSIEQSSLPNSDSSTSISTPSPTASIAPVPPTRVSTRPSAVAANFALQQLGDNHVLITTLEVL